MADESKTDEYDSTIETIISLATRDEIEGALNIAGDILIKQPNRSEGYFALGIIANQQGERGRALELIKSAHELNPEYREYADALAVLYTLSGKLSDGLYFAKLATTLIPHPKLKEVLPTDLSDYFQALENTAPSRHHLYAQASYNVRDFANAAEQCEQELRINDTHLDALRLLAKSYLELGNYGRAEEVIKAAIAVDSNASESYSTLGKVFMHLGEFENGIEAHRVALAKDGESIDVATAAVIDARFLDDTFAEAQTEFSTAARKRISAMTPDPDDNLSPPEPRSKEIIRVGYLSNSLYDSIAGVQIQTLMGFYNSDRFEIYIYQMSIAKDAVNVDILTRATSSREIYDLDDDVVGMIIANDQIDVLVDMCGYTEGHRAGVIAQQQAPVQIGLLNYPYGFDVTGINYVLSDAITKEIDNSALGNGQNTIELEYGLVAVESFSALQDVQELPALTNGRVTFGGLCDLAYLTPGVAAAWAKVLKATPDARLLLGNVKMVPPVVRDRVERLFAPLDVGDRIEFLETQSLGKVQEDFYHRIDILLDTFPVSGEVKLCEALWMGVPVITLSGNRRSAQMGASVLYTAGKPEWICTSEDQMADVAAALANDVPTLAELREHLRDEVAGAALFNPRLMVRSLENAYIKALNEIRSEKI